ncbi:MAG: peptidoglycan bridge formation glycyltransferase FemA/FemB family protein, partial [Candidatus Spechtbacteria bacterium]|nr:peptidoglycan bridge formation glycyltransferase FemA/FemB family protein [Candidatus Spechtbacteria bacterium]
TESSEKACDAQVFTAWYNNEPLASAIVVFYGNSAFYHHGASSSIYPKIPAPYLLQWRAILEAKKRGKKLYNFWGIIRDTGKKHPWAGITLFKKGFGGFQTDYLHAQDLPLSWKYWPSWVIETLRKKRRNL